MKKQRENANKLHFLLSPSMLMICATLMNGVLHTVLSLINTSPPPLIILVLKHTAIYRKIKSYLKKNLLFVRCRKTVKS